MSRRMLMATVAALALAVPAAAQEQPKPPLDTEQPEEAHLSRSKQANASLPGRASRDAGGARSHRRKGGGPAAGYDFHPGAGRSSVPGGRGGDR